MARERETQAQLKQVLGIRTFDQIQSDLSDRQMNEEKLKTKTEKNANSSMNP